MKRVSLNTVSVLCLLGCLALGSCEQRIGFGQPEPVSGDMTVHITPMWNVEQRPSRLNALFYDPTGALAKEVQLPVAGGDVTLAKNTYRVILCNPDVEYVVFDHMDQLTRAMARVAAVGSKSDQRLENPGALFSTVFELPLGVAEAQQLMVFRPVGITIRLKAEDVILSGALEVTVRLRNVADGINLATGQAYHTSQGGLTVSAMQNGGVENKIYSFTGSAFGCCVQPDCNHSFGSEVYADIEVTAPDGSVKTVSADISAPLKKAQESLVEVAIDITVTQMALSAVVTGWTLGSASGSIIRSV